MKQTSTDSRPHIPRPRRRRPRLLRTLGWGAEAAFLWSFWKLAGSLDAERASRLGNRVFSWLGPRLEKQKFVRNNLCLAFPELNTQQREILAREVWGNFGAVLAEYPHLHRLSGAEPGSAIETELHETTRAIIEAKQPAIYIAAHLANWELAAAAITAAGVPLSVVYAPQGNPLTNRLLQRARRSLGCRFIAKNNALRRLARAIRAGESVGILPDQRVDSGASVRFFGHDALTTTSPAWLALKSSCPLIPVQIERIGAARYKAVFHPPVNLATAPHQGTAVLDITNTINCLFESWIRRTPGQWLCMRRRWPTVAAHSPTRRLD